MPINTFEKTSLGWRLSQLQQQLGEWWEYQFYKNLPELPTGSISPWLANLLKFLFWLVLGLLLAWVAWRLWREFNPYIYSWLSSDRNSKNSQAPSHFDDKSVALLLERSQQLYRQGNYREACRCLYLAILQHLHDTKVIVHKPSRTDGEYLQLLQSTVTSMQPYETLITTHEQLCFSDTEILPENYEQCRQAYREVSPE
ncbi:DUF4129 domain-containing protein [Halotia branconii]|uniref:DUF4129 domain-containing protein n=1 Tax=Halotia branconii CENA392 TaxID=1539056 RepID=A0AAJ6NSV3_9CYAN|nr:DUF4129 domain-containing protein [Halotia branconii]WGV25896.1 DUF4129 domain-containing protein [Halotia branconii CENA392]